MKCSHQPRSLRNASLLVSLLLAGLAGCGGDAKPKVTETDGEGIGEALGLPGESVLRRSSSTAVITDPNQGGTAQALVIEEVFWGQLVNVYSHPDGGARELRHQDFLVGENLDELFADGRVTSADLLVERNFITGARDVTILHAFDSEEYLDVLLAIREGLQPVNPHPATYAEFGNLSVVPRNAAIAIRFSDLVSTSSISADTVRVLQGIPPEQPFGARIFADQNHGQLFLNTDDPDGEYVFRSTRVIVDCAVSVFEAANATSFIAVNATGLPPAPDQENPNVAIRIPTQNAPETGSFATLKNLAGNPVTQNDVLADSSSPTVDVVRGFRSGGPNDPSNGYLYDATPPSLVTQLSADVSNIRCVSGTCPDPGNLYLVDLEFASALCARVPVSDDLLELDGGIVLRVASDAAAVTDQVVSDLLVEDLTGGDLNALKSSLPAGGVAASQFVTPLRGADLTAGLEQCFISFSPQTGDSIAAITPNSSVKIRFSEPMDPAGLNGLEDFIVARDSGTELSPDNIVVGTSRPTSDLQRFSFEPALPFSHVKGESESYFVLIGAQESRGLTDLAGNRIVEEIPPIEFTLDPDAATDQNGGFVLRFNPEDFVINEFNEEPAEPPGLSKFDGPEIAGQFLHNPDRGIIRPRPVVRFSMVVDRENQVVSNMDNLPLDPQQIFVTLPPDHYVYELGTNEPMTPFGSRMMSVWRYCDMGLALNSTPAPEGYVLELGDAFYYNIDVEGVSWAVRGAVQADQYELFEMALAHAKKFPDEEWFTPGFPAAPNSGLQTDFFSSNALPDGTTNPLKVVHPRNLGYSVDPALAFRAATDQLMMPYPLNQGSNPDLYRYYTWRDTAIQAVGGDASVGVDPLLSMSGAVLGVPATVLGLTLGLDGQIPATFAIQGWLPSITLPLLMDFRCFPDSGSGFNKPDYKMAGMVQATVPPIGVYQPADFRVTSTGGVDVNNNIKKVNPDLALSPTGGFNQNPALATVSLGTPTAKGDSLFQLGQLDLVYRVSRVYTRWIETTGFNSLCEANVEYLPPVLVPSSADQPNGTSIQLAYRGAANVAALNQTTLPNPPGPLKDSRVLDAYGDERDQTGSIPSTYGDPAARNASVAFCPGVGNLWSSSIQDIDGSGFIQVRLSMINNVRSGVSPYLTAFGIVYDVVD